MRSVRRHRTGGQPTPPFGRAVDAIVGTVRASDFVGTGSGHVIVIGFPGTAARRYSPLIEERIRQTIHDAVEAPLEVTIEVAEGDAIAEMFAEGLTAMRALSFLQSLDLCKHHFICSGTRSYSRFPATRSARSSCNATRLWRQAQPPVRTDFTFSVILAGHNEAKPCAPASKALAEQTILAELGAIEVIVVDDGSTDRMLDVALDLQREGKIDKVLRLEQRGGKSAAVNLGLSVCTGDIVVISDIDTTFDRDAFAELLGYFADPRVGAVSGNLGVRNAYASLITRYQAIEYAIGISLGRCIQDVLGILSIVSGAFGAFRRAAIEQVGGQDVEVGEDADLTMKLRRAGWRIRFAPDAHALTDVPETVSALISQRLRWDRGLVTIWMRKFRGVFDPRQSTFRLIDVAALADVIGFQVLLALVFPVYLVWLLLLSWRSGGNHRRGDADRLDGSKPVVFRGRRGDRNPNAVPACSLLSALHDFADLR